MDVQAVPCNLKIIDMYVQQAEFDRSEAYKNDILNLKFKLHVDIKVLDNNKKCKTAILVEIIDEKNKFLDIKINFAGIFELINFDKLDKKTRHNLINKNTIAILFPYVRSYITTITSQSGMKPVILPPINVSALIDLQNSNTRKKQNQEIEKD